MSGLCDVLIDSDEISQFGKSSGIRLSLMKSKLICWLGINNERRKEKLVCNAKNVDAPVNVFIRLSRTRSLKRTCMHAKSLATRRLSR